MNLRLTNHEKFSSIIRVHDFHFSLQNFNPSNKASQFCLSWWRFWSIGTSQPFEGNNAPAEVTFIKTETAFLNALVVKALFLYCCGVHSLLRRRKLGRMLFWCMIKELGVLCASTDSASSPLGNRLPRRQFIHLNYCVSLLLISTSCKVTDMGSFNDKFYKHYWLHSEKEREKIKRITHPPPKMVVLH